MSESTPVTPEQYAAIKRDADPLWHEIHCQLEAGLGVPAVEMNRLHWHAALQELEILRNELSELRRTANAPLSSNPSAFWYCSCRHPKTKVYYADEMDRLRAGLLKIATGGAEFPIGEAATILFGERYRGALNSSVRETSVTHFAFLSQGPRDSEPWPTIYVTRELADKAPNRVSDVVEVRLVVKSTSTADVDGYIAGHSD